MNAEGATFERHYRISELAALWGLGRETVRKLCMNEPDVLKVSSGASMPTQPSPCRPLWPNGCTGN
jgi:hypothetical protein